jgi:hypothetical protein
MHMMMDKDNNEDNEDNNTDAKAHHHGRLGCNAGAAITTTPTPSLKT